MRIFITGGTGYVGGVLCRRLLEEGHEVRALVRPHSGAAGPHPLGSIGIATFPGDITDRPSLRVGMSGADWVIHAAAELSHGAGRKRMEAVNVQGSENVASLAYKLGVGRFLSVSSFAYFGGSPPDGTPGTEASPPLLPFPNPYGATKHAGEQAIQGWAKQGLRVNTVYPSLIYGPPGKKEGSNALLGGLIRGKFPVLVAADRRVCWVYIDDVIAGILKVMNQAPPDRAYLLAGEITTIRDLARRVSTLAGVSAPRWELPLGVVRLLANLAAPVLHLAGRRLPMPVQQLRSLIRHWAFDDRRARTELDWHPRRLDEGLPPTIECLRRNL